MRNHKITKNISLAFLFILSSLTPSARSQNLSFFSGQKISKRLELQASKKDDSNFDYEFDTSSSFSNNGSDEFESMGLNDGKRSGEKIENNNGEIYVTKNENNVTKSDISTATYNDSCENNDSFLTASSAYAVGTNDGGIYKHWVWCYATISQKTEGMLWWKQTYIDKDFYSFDVVSVGTLKVTLSDIPTNCDYDLRLYKIEDKLECSYASCNFDDPIASSANASNTDENVSISVKPGTYYACVYSYKDQTFDNNNPYKLTFEEDVDDTRYGSYYSINNGRNDGDLGAVWRSDYKPLGITPVNISEENAQVGLANSSTYPYIKHLIDKYSSDEKITYAIVYVWDVELRALIRSALQLILEEIYEREETYFNAFNISWNAANLFISIGGLIVSTISLANIATSALLTGAITATSLSMGFISTILSFAIGYQFQIERQELINYLINAISAFEVGKGSNNKEVVMLKFKYRFIKKERWYLDWTPSYDVDGQNRYNEDQITHQLKGSPINGRIIGFQDEHTLYNLLGF